MHAEQTEGVMSTIGDWTGGERPVSCPWRAFRDPFVQRVMSVASLQPGEVSWYAPNPSHRLVEGLAHYRRVGNLVESKVIAAEREQRKAAQR